MADEPAGGPRTLADILREAGIESSGRGGRRRAAAPDPAPEPAPEPVPDAEPAPAPDPAPTPAPAPAPPPDPTPPPEPAGPPDPADPSEPADPPDRSRVLPTLLLLVELVLAALVGVVVYYTFGLLWELYPYVGVAAAALVLAGFAAAGQWFRLRRGGGPLPPLVLGAVLLVGAVLTLLPAADVLTR